mmetsp:Transcript_11926/g.27962  ORF Transcript_11926/g.27962 Transcript_11926/m.27962 type:complete len:87 (-) Transcript_11926:97-357(-)|eukprot:CAMPEP_0171091546 /NCGR_PEP_ID=MMETSP0766_2-20121228/33931_1 /TAXON_ID=439317 /ORGANISM="Gambierdiscus australes, Strain CAWD 149" /LENGTH=86 /DNA_ID=CAMNT_0011549661 /DNA_START=75 /DNA_END=335 /DNA_ORIENTATION=+
MSGAGSRDRQNLVLRYNYFLNTLDDSLTSEGTPRNTLESQYRDLLEFVRTLSKEERTFIQRENRDWDAERRRKLQERCRERLPGIL